MQALKDYRIKRGLSRAALGKELGMSGALIYQLETGRRQIGIKRLKKVSEATGIAPADLRPDEKEVLR